MRVAIATQEYPPDTGWGGIGSFSYGLAHALAAKGVDVDVVSCVEDQPSSTTTTGRLTVHRTGLPDWGKVNGRLNRHLPTTGSRLRIARAVRQAIAALPAKPDVIEAPDWMGEALLLHGCVVVHLHSPLAVLNRRRGLAITHDLRASEWLEWVAARRATAVTAPSYQATALDDTHDWLPRARVQLCSMPLDDAMLTEAGQSERPEPLVAMIGRLDKLKAPEVLLDAMALLKEQVPGLRAVLAGHANATESPDGTDYIQWLAARAEELSLDVELPGRISRDEVQQLCRSARVVAVPSLFETFSMAAAEALAVGTPAVVTQQCGIAPWLEDAYPGAVVPAGDPAALAEALLVPLTDELQARTRGAAGRAVITSRCDPDSVAEGRLALYRRLGVS